MIDYNNSLNKLKDFFKSFKYEYDSNDFFKSLKNYSEDTKIITDCVPTPFVGSIENPDIIVLALNPSFDKGQDEMDKIILDWNESDNYYDFLTRIDVVNVNDSAKRIPFTTAWWRNVFDGVTVNKSVGIFNLMCYHSKHYPTTKKILLLSQEIVIDYIKALLNNNKEIKVIFVWGKKYWLNFISDELKGHTCFELNEGNNKMNNSISNAINNKISNYKELKKLFG